MSSGINNENPQSSNTDIYTIDMEAIIEISQKDHKGSNADDQDLDKVLPKLAKRLNDTQPENNHPHIDSSQSHLATTGNVNAITDDENTGVGKTRTRSLSKTRANSVVIVQLSSGLTPELEKLRTEDINTDDNSAAFKALHYKSLKHREITIDTKPTIETLDTSAGDASVGSEKKKKKKKKQPKQKVEGREIQQDHKQYELTYAMMLGIRVMTGRCDMVDISTQRSSLKKLGSGIVGGGSEHVDNSNHQYDWNSAKAKEMLVERELVSEDFHHTLELKFQPEGSTDSLYSTPKHKLKFSFMFKDYVPKVFRAIRGLSGIKESDYMLSIAGDLSYIEFLANSKSGQFFFYSNDGKYMIKTQSKEECVLLRHIMPKYVQHLSDHPNSLLVRFYGMHRVKFKTQTLYFVIMSSVFDTNVSPIHIKYDLKGSLQGRLTSEKDCKLGKVQKDLNLIANGHTINLSDKNIKIFHDTLQSDVELLNHLNIMDYSLLVGIHFGESNAENATLTRRNLASGVTDKQQTVTRDRRNSEDSDIDYDCEDGNDGSIFQSYYGGIAGESSSNDREPHVYFMGIIDILQLYDTGKMTESIFKGLFTNRMELSAIRPELYAKRMLDFIMKHTNYDEVMKREKETRDHPNPNIMKGLSSPQSTIEPKHNPNWAKIADYIQAKKYKDDRRKALL